MVIRVYKNCFRPVHGFLYYDGKDIIIDEGAVASDTDVRDSRNILANVSICFGSVIVHTSFSGAPGGAFQQPRRLVLKKTVFLRGRAR